MTIESHYRETRGALATYVYTAIALAAPSPIREVQITLVAKRIIDALYLDEWTRGSVEIAVGGSVIVALAQLAVYTGLELSYSELAGLIGMGAAGALIGGVCAKIGNLPRGAAREVAKVLAVFYGTVGAMTGTGFVDRAARFAGIAGGCEAFSAIGTALGNRFYKWFHETSPA